MTAIVNRRRFLVITACVAVVAVVGIVLATRSSAQASAITDGGSTGGITLYDQAGAPLTTGSVATHPFVAKAVSSIPLPAAYRAAGAKATLLAFQPRQGIPASAWSGDTLTAASPIADPAHPAVVAAATDFSLADFLDEFPARWDGTIELRIFVSAPGLPPMTTSYPSVMLHISGDTWTVGGKS